MTATVRHADDFIDHHALDWARVTGSRFVVRQRTTYVYDGPIHHLRHRLMVVPPVRHGDQRRIDHGVDVTGTVARVAHLVDGFGNHVIDVQADRVGEVLELETWCVAERTAGGGPALTIAVGREYSDVAPTYGTYSGEGLGRLSIVKRVGLTSVDLAPMEEVG